MVNISLKEFAKEFENGGKIDGGKERKRKKMLSLSKTKNASVTMQFDLKRTILLTGHISFSIFKLKKKSLKRTI